MSTKNAGPRRRSSGGRTPPAWREVVQKIPCDASKKDSSYATRQ